VRGFVVLGLSLLTAVAVGVATHSARSAPLPAGSAVSCNQSQLVFLFWPNGHGAIKSVDFSPYKTPHLEIYKYTAGYPNSAFLGFAAANKLTSFAAVCRSARGKLGGAVRHSKRVTKQLVVTCSVPKDALIAARPVGRGLKVDAGAKGSLVVSATITTTGSTFSYDAKRCSSGPSPH
jgi:hypothetical protein